MNRRERFFSGVPVGNSRMADFDVLVIGGTGNNVATSAADAGLETAPVVRRQMTDSNICGILLPNRERIYLVLMITRLKWVHLRILSSMMPFHRSGRSSKTERLAT
jgi:hypothetical protein